VRPYLKKKKKKKKIIQKDWWSGLRCRPWVQTPVPKKKKSPHRNKVPKWTQQHYSWQPKDENNAIIHHLLENQKRERERERERNVCVTLLQALPLKPYLPPFFPPVIWGLFAQASLDYDPPGAKIRKVRHSEKFCTSDWPRCGSGTALTRQGITWFLPSHGLV
jgi:hypothetical protein